MENMQTVTEVARTLYDKQLEVDVWDLPPTVLVVKDHRDGGEPAVAVVEVHTMDGESQPVEVALREMAMVMMFDPKSLPPLPFTGPVAGVVLRTEGYGLFARSQEDFDDYEKFIQGGGRIGDHPLGKEVVSFIAVCDQGAVAIVHARGDGPQDHPVVDVSQVEADVYRALVVFHNGAVKLAHD